MDDKPDGAKFVSPVSGKELNFMIRASCRFCGCLVSHSSVKAVEKALQNYEKCKKCGNQEVTIKYTIVEYFVA